MNICEHFEEVTDLECSMCLAYKNCPAEGTKGKPMNIVRNDDGRLLVHGNSMTDWHIAVTPSGTLCGSRPPLDMTVMTTWGEPTCEACKELLAVQEGLTDIAARRVHEVKQEADNG